MSNNFIPCLKWIQRGVAKTIPDVLHLSKEELKEMIEYAKHDICRAANIHEKTGTADDHVESTGNHLTDDEFNMEYYDNDEDFKSLVSIENLISMDDERDQNFEDREDEEVDSDDEIKPTDNLIAVAHVIGDASYLEVYVYNEDKDDLYVHHDVLLPTIPLCFEWLNYSDTNTPGNLLAIGGMTPEITIWNLDEVNSLIPCLKLGVFSEKKKHQHRNHGHRDAVLDLSWSDKLPHILASGSVDRTVLLWDLDRGRAQTQFKEFQEKVQSVEFHPSEVNLLVTGACDSFVRLLDCRIEETLNSVKVSGEVERVIWHPIYQFQALVGTSTGELSCIDIRTEKFLWSIQAHSKEVTGIGVHKNNHKLLLTCSTDETLKSWNFTNMEPLLVNTKYCKQELQCLQICPENPNIFCLGGVGKVNSFRTHK